MGKIVDLKRTPPIDDQELVADLCRFSEGLLTEKQVKKRHKLPESTWNALGDDEELILKIENEKLRRIRDGSSKRELAQKHIVRGPGILNDIMSGGSDVSPRHKIDAIRTLDGMAANSPAGTAGQSDRFIISIILNSDDGSAPHTLHFDKPIAIDTDNTDTTLEESAFAAIATKKKDDNGGQGYL